MGNPVQVAVQIARDCRIERERETTDGADMKAVVRLVDRMILGVLGGAQRTGAGA